MPLELRIEKNGKDRCVRPFWHGRFEVNGDRQCLNLGVKVRGNPPASLSLKDLGNVIEEARTKQGSVRLVEKNYEIKVGEAIKTVLLPCIVLCMRKKAVSPAQRRAFAQEVAGQELCSQRPAGLPVSEAGTFDVQPSWSATDAGGRTSGETPDGAVGG